MGVAVGARTRRKCLKSGGLGCGLVATGLARSFRKQYREDTRAQE